MTPGPPCLVAVQALATTVLPAHTACLHRCTAVPQEIRITGATVFVNPYKELLEEQAAAEAAKRKQVGACGRLGAGWVGGFGGSPAGGAGARAGADDGWVVGCSFEKQKLSCCIHPLVGL